MKRIYLAYTGGTLGMQPSALGLAPAPLRKRLEDALLHLPLQDVEWVLYEYPHLIDSSMAQPNDWYVIARDIAARYNDYDGFVVLHGTDTLAYTASLLSFALRGLNKPVVVTGSQCPLGVEGGDAQSNVFGALAVATHSELAEVCVYFAGKILRANRTEKVSSQAFSAFESPHCAALGEFISGAEIMLAPHAHHASQQLEAFELPVVLPAFDLGILHFHPAITMQQIKHYLAYPWQCVVLRTYGSGNVPLQLNGLLDAFNAAAQRGMVLINHSQCLHGYVEQGRYAAAAGLSQAGVISALDMTLPALITKLYHGMARDTAVTVADLRSSVLEDWCGELTQSAC